MARAGMARWRTKNPASGNAEGGDEVQRSLELLDRVLSEFDDLENGNVAAVSEDDGYMSMNGRRAKFSLSVRPVSEDLPPEPPPHDFPPPPEEAERLISTLLPKVSPASTGRRACSWRGRGLFTLSADDSPRVTTATQTTLPKTRQQRPFWRCGSGFASLPHEGWRVALPPCTVPGAGGRHREVRRHDDFSDDSLEELPVSSKRGSVAWEVPLDDMDALLTPGSTKVVGRRRRRRSTDHSSSGSIHRLRDSEEWPEPPPSTEDETPSPFSDSYYDSSATNEQEDIPQVTTNGTYVIRKGRKKERKPMPPIFPSTSSPIQDKVGELKRASSTFDNIKSLLKEGLIEGLDEAPPDFAPPTPPNLVRVVSLPALTTDDNIMVEVNQVTRASEEPHMRSRTDIHRVCKPQELAVTMEEEEDTQCCSSLEETSDRPCEVIDLSFNEEENELIKELEKEHLQNLQNKSTDETSSDAIEDLEKEFEKRISLDHGIVLDVEPLVEKMNEDVNNEMEVTVVEINHKVRDNVSNGPTYAMPKRHSIPPSEKIPPKPPIRQSSAREVELKDPWISVNELAEVHKVRVEVELGPLPPSPVEEDEDEYSEILHPSPRGKADTLPEPFYRTGFPARPCPPEPPPHMSSLKTRSMDAGFSRGHRPSRREGSSERRTLPCELSGAPRRRAYQRRGEGLQASCSLPETPLSARGCDIPRTPQRPGVGQALAGAELLRLAGGPGRGWYPRHRRPASSEHLDHAPHPWEPRKPLTLPPNLSPKFFHRSPRDALRRVTSLLIRKGSSSKEGKTKDQLSPSTIGEASGEPRQKRGFFRSLWKRSRHYSLEQQ